jgi:hypothetical protein
MTELDAIVGRTSVHLIEWIDHTLELRGVDPRSNYAERFWLPTLGPPTLPSTTPDSDRDSWWLPSPDSAIGASEGVPRTRDRTNLGRVAKVGN